MWELEADFVDDDRRIWQKVDNNLDELEGLESIEGGHHDNHGMPQCLRCNAVM